jgi:hypothetical protein
MSKLLYIIYDRQKQGNAATCFGEKRCEKNKF